MKKNEQLDILDIIKTEYISDPKTSYRKLAEKHKVPVKKIAAVGKKEQWGQLRERTQDKIIKKTINKISTEKSDKLAKAIDTAEGILKHIEKSVKDRDQFNRYIVTEGFKVKEKKFKKTDTKSLKNLTAALKDIVDILEIAESKDKPADTGVSIRIEEGSDLYE